MRLRDKSAEYRTSGVPAEQLETIRSTENSKVLDWLSLHKGENYLVSDDCATIYTDKPDARNTRALSNLLAGISKNNPEILFAETATFNTVSDLADELSRNGEMALQGEESSDIIRNLEYLFADAIRQNASDIHLRIGQRTTLMLRIHGLLFLQRYYSRRAGLCFARATFNYFAQSSQDFSLGLPLDGAFNFNYANHRYGIRVNLMPEIRGCILVLRIRNPNNRITLNNAGYTEAQCRTIRLGIARGSGMILFSGPTNSGKSTTMSNLLAEVSTERNIVSIEDPVEVQLPNVAHVDLSVLNDRVPLEKLLGCTVRQDPDLLSLAEIRDIQTAQFAENMVLQGRLVIATLHADSIGAIPHRLTKLGFDEGNLLLPGFLSVLINQALLPALCEHCSLKSVPGDADQTAKPATSQSGMRYRNSGGCQHCRKGIQGRILVAEVLGVCRQVRNWIRHRDYDALYEKLQSSTLPSRAGHARHKAAKGLLDPGLVAAMQDDLFGELPCAG